MCGILGMFSPAQPIDLEAIQQATNAIQHRGPDDEGYLLINISNGHIATCLGPDSMSNLDLPRIEKCFGQKFDLAFGFRRLSILDLSISGHQPMSSPDGRYWIIFNGEIYNYLELREELGKLGCQFVSSSDTEVLLAGYIHWGKGLLNKLVGMFAFAILDLNERRLFVARDFFGIKPLYYTLKDNKFAFASEAKALLKMKHVGGAVDADAAYLYLRHGLTDHDETSMWRDIRKLPPAHLLDISLDSLGAIQPQRYWHLDADQYLNISASDAAAQLRDLFLQNVRLHLRSDVPVGAALSGGIDSTAIISAMRHIQGKGLDLHTFTYLADDPAINEEKWADLAAQSTGANVHKTVFSADNLVADIDSLIYSLDEPFGSTSIYAQYCVFRLAHQNRIKVMLDGQGADELLGGYTSYLSGRLLSLFSRGSLSQAFRFLRNIRDRPDSDNTNLLLRSVGLITPEFLRSTGQILVGARLFPAWMNASWFEKQNVKARSIISGDGFNKKQALRSLLYQTFTTRGLPALLRYEDHNSMAHSVESRVPFLTPEIVNFIFSLPEEYIIDNDGTSKSVFRQAMRGIVAEPILNRRDKIGFQTPERHLLTTLNPWIEKILNSSTAREIPVLNIQKVKLEYQQILTGQKPFDNRVWRWINFIRWAELFGTNFITG